MFTGYYNPTQPLPNTSPVLGAQPSAQSAPTNQSGTQANPLSAFFSASGATGNKTTNKDLPQWLRDIGMKGDAYAGGMLKPEIRYGFAYKNGQIHFADGTSFAAKKNKGGTYSYTDASGQPVTYSPTDEQNAYNKKYQSSTSGFFSNFKDSLNPLNHKSPFGEAGLLGDPLHYIGGDKYDHFMRQTWEGPNKALSPYVKDFNVFDRQINPLHRAIDGTSLGMAARNTVENKPGDVIGSIIGGGAIVGGLGGAGSAAGGAGQAGAIGGTEAAGAGFGATGSGFAGASSFAPGLSVGGGAAGQLAAAGGITGGAGTGIIGSLGGGAGLLSQSSIGNAAQLSGLLGGGKQQQGAPSMPYVQSVLGNQIPQQQQAQQQFIGLPMNTQMPYIPARGYTPHDFYGATVWS